MPKRFLIYTGVLLLVLSASCAKRNTEYQPEEWLTLEREIPVVGNPVDIDVDAEYIYLAQDQGGISLTRQSDYQHRWITKITASDGSEMVLGRIKKISMLPEIERLCINEIAATDKITIMSTEDPDTLVYKFDFVGGTGGIRHLDSMPVPGNANFPMAVICSSASGVRYDLYDGNLVSINQYTILPPATASGFTITDDYVFVTAEQRGLFVYNRANQQYISDLPLPGEAQNVVLSGNLALIPSRQAGLHLVDVSDPSHPILKSTFNTSGYATMVDVLGSKVAISSGSGGIYLLDISDATAPVLLQHLSSCGYTNGVRFLANNKIAVAARDHGLQIYIVK